MKIVGSVNETDLINEKIRFTSLIMCLLALCFFVHPYRGIYHDARLYAVQALSHLFPEAYKNDLFFLFGSQDSYSIFSFFYAYAIKLVGLNAAAITLQISGHLLWFSAAWFLARSLLKGSPAFWVFLVLVTTLSGQYGKSELSYGEPFLTPRIFAEALVLFGTAFLVAQKDLPAFLLLSIAFLFHPLMAAGGMLFSFFYKACTDRKWFSLPIAALLSVFLAAYLDIPPFTRLFQTMDNEWYGITKIISPMAYLDTWEPEHFNTIIFDACIIGSGILAATRNLRRFLFASLLTGSAGMLLSAIGTYLLRNVFIIQVQPWRAYWLMHLFACLAEAFLISEFWGRSRFSRMLLSAYLAAWFMIPLVPFSGVVAISTFLAHLLFNKKGDELHIRPVIERFLFFTFFTAGMIWLIYMCLFAYIQLLKTPNGMSLTSFAQEILADTKLPLIFGFFFIKSLIYKTEKRKVLAAFLTIVLLCNAGAAWTWDQRNPQDKFIERNAMKGNLFKNKISTGSVICWPDYFFIERSINKIWFVCGTASYADPVQAAGIIFSREKAIKYWQRMKKLESLGFFDPRHHEIKESAIPKPAFSEIARVSSDPDMDYLVLNFKYPIGLVDSYYDEYSKKKYFLYDCMLIRNEKSRRNEE